MHMSRNAKVYRFEVMKQPGEASTGDQTAPTNVMFEKVMHELAALRQQLARGVSVEASAEKASASDELVEKVGKKLAAKPTDDRDEVQDLRKELNKIYEAIAETKREIATISSIGFDTTSGRPVDELDAVVKGTEVATNQILTAIENVERDATTLANSLAGDEGLIASNIQEQIVSIYEACNFQDITGQRIAKVVQVLKFVSERTDKMISIWGGIESFDEVDVDAAIGRIGDAKLLNGPALETDVAVASQDDIDALFD